MTTQTQTPDDDPIAQLRMQAEIAETLGLTIDEFYRETYRAGKLVSDVVRSNTTSPRTGIVVLGIELMRHVAINGDPTSDYTAETVGKRTCDVINTLYALVGPVLEAIAKETQK